MTHATQLGILAVRAIGSGPGAMSVVEAEQRDGFAALAVAPDYSPHAAGAAGFGGVMDEVAAAMVAELQTKKEAAVSYAPSSPLTTKHASASGGWSCASASHHARGSVAG